MNSGKHIAVFGQAMFVIALLGTAHKLKNASTIVRPSIRSRESKTLPHFLIRGFSMTAT